MANEPTGARETVTVACKLPHGIIIRAGQLESTQELVMGGGTRDVKVWREAGERIVINGNAAPHGKSPVDLSGEFIPLSDGGYALTHNVPKDIWDRWLHDNSATAMVRNNLIFARPKQPDIRAIARENEKQLSGLERLNPDSDPRMPKRRTAVRGGAVSAIETARPAAAA